MSFEKQLELLNKSQYKAVTAPPGPLMIIAGAGSGKTRVITYRILYLINQLGISPSSILGITFTNKAAGEMKERVAANLGYGERANLGTFHGICAKILRREAEFARADKNFVIFDSGDSGSAIKRIIKNLDLPQEQFNHRAVAGRISRYKNDLLTPQQVPTSNFYEVGVADVYSKYEVTLKANNAYDFGDLIMESVNMFRRNQEVLKKYWRRFEHILVDEYQDTNRAQYALMYLLSRGHANITIVGDPDQSIYRWRGAEPGNFSTFLEAFPDAKVLNLEQNYRSHQGILNLANALIKYNNSASGEKELWSDRENEITPQLFSCEDDRYEVLKVLGAIEDARANYGLGYGDCAILYRVNATSRIFEEEFTKRQVPFKVIGGTRFYERKEVKNAVAYLRSVHTINDTISFSRIINVPPRGVGNKSVSMLENAQRTRSLQEVAADGAILSQLPKKAGNSLRKLTGLLTELRVELENGAKASALLDTLMERTGYLKYLEDEKDIQGQARADNVKELIAAAHDFEEAYPEGTVSDFLESVTLVQDADQIEEIDAINLMTLHTAKGLEFPAIFIVGLEEFMLPHSNSMNSTDEIEEERRLCYVGITRAMDLLYLSYVQVRNIRGVPQPRTISRFVKEIMGSGIELETDSRVNIERTVKHDPWKRHY